MKIAHLLISLPLLAACGGGDSSATDIATGIQDAVSAVTKTVEVTEDNDPNNAIGRPGSYTQAVVLYDERTACDDGETVHVSCGAKVEVFEDADEAAERAAYLKALTEGMQGLVTEYDYVKGSVVLRVSGELKPSEAEEYETAFSG